MQSPKLNTDPAGRALTDRQLNQVITAAKAVDPTTAPMVLVMARCGLRIGEAIALRRSDIDLDNGLLTVSRSMSRREGLRPVKGRSDGDRGRTIPMPSDVVDRFRLHLAAQPVVNISGFLFTAPMGGPISYGTGDAGSGARSLSGSASTPTAMTFAIASSPASSPSMKRAPGSGVGGAQRPQNNPVDLYPYRF